MTRDDFEKEFPKIELDKLIETAFQFLRKNKKLDLWLSHTNIKELYDCEDKTTECHVEVYYFNGHEIHDKELIEMLFTKDYLFSDSDSGADKIKDKKTKLIVRIAWRIWRHEVQSNNKK